MDSIIEAFRQTSLVSWFGLITSVVCVYLIVKEKDYNWPIGIAASVALVWVFWRQKLYATVGLQVFYTFECFYGWWMWTRRDLHSGRRIVRIGDSPTQTRIILLAIVVIMVPILTWVLRKTGDPYPFWDALVGIASLVAEYMLCLKQREAWLVYLGCDIISLIVLYRLGDYVTFATYLAFTFLCITGMIEWTRRFRDPQRYEPELNPAGILARGTG